MSVNKVIIVGHLGQDPELKYTKENLPVTNISVATNEKWKDKQGNQHEKTEWHRLIIWGKQAENAAQYLKKGSQAYFEGKLETQKWEDKEGKTNYTTNVVVTNMQFLGSSGGGGGGQRPPTPNAPSGAPTFSGDDDGPL